MMQANSYSLPNSGTYLGLHLMQVLVIGEDKKKISRKNVKFEKLIDNYQKQLLKKAIESPEWYPYAKYLKVRLENKVSIRVEFAGPKYLEDIIKLIEYGSGDSVASPLMRVSEAEFNSDFEAKRMFAA